MLRLRPRRNFLRKQSPWINNGNRDSNCKPFLAISALEIEVIFFREYRLIVLRVGLFGQISELD
jgi:hypothetical protein